jgi:hypothetical protein
MKKKNYNILSKKIGFIDESGDKSIHFEKSGVTTFFIVSAVIIDEKNVDKVRNEFIKIAKRYTQAPEIKSNAKAFRKIENRINFLKKLSKLDFRIYSIIVDKRKKFENSGLQFRDSFFKYVSGLLDNELYNYFPYLELTSDEHGSEKFMDGFIKYVEKNHKQTVLFRGPEFKFDNSINEPLIQLADFIAGSIAKCYEPDKIQPRSQEIIEVLNERTLHLREWPEAPPKLFRKIDDVDEKFNHELVDFIFFRINEFIASNQDTSDSEIKNQLICLHYLIYRFKQDPYSYTFSDEIIDRINVRKINLTKRIFRKNIIEKLFDNKILITSSQSGYKIPCCKGDIIRYYNNYSTKIIPMINTIGKTDTLIKSVTLGKINLLESQDFKILKKLIKANT